MFDIRDAEVFGEYVVSEIKGMFADKIKALADENASMKSQVAAMQLQLANIKTSIKELPAGPVGPQGEKGEQGEIGLRGERGEQGEIGAPGLDGKNGEPGKDGKDGRDGADGQNLSLDDVRDCLNDLVSKAVGSLPVPRHCTGGYIRRDGNLLLAFSDGGFVDLGKVVGQDGKDCDLEKIERRIKELFASIEKPKDGKDGRDGKDGAPGKDGKDGLAIEDMKAEITDDGVLVHKYFRNGSLVVENRFKLKYLHWCGVYKAGTKYDAQNVVTWDGSGWVANCDTMDRPRNGSKDWTLFVKCGRDGKDGQSITGPAGPPGRDGNDAPRWPTS